MKFNELVSEINRLVAATPYTREEIAALWRKEEDDKFFSPDVLFSYAAALEFLHTHGESEKAKSIRDSYELRLKDLIDFYSRRESVSPTLSADSTATPNNNIN